ncbi:hypothetical protein ACFYWN_22215 [Streptomyces sp. NPDC002917]|uniref:hypothetical protein n=1 Tax=unclassified Streptomyces TaxID=2593676 RepID=UPI002E7FF483|nr:hypothetical protein [Streptomyces sp. NBC_00562]WTF25838.1 hypothetical protein OG955_06140 [Streptomyces sp. NBC_01602]WUC24401.1 hypothetical protein OHA33_39590 [Streptomyces sp. NBC_00562]
MSHTLQWNANRFERTARAVSWTVAAYHADERQVCATGSLHSADSARYWHGRWSGKRSVRRVELAERAIDIAERFIAMG